VAFFRLEFPMLPQLPLDKSNHFIYGSIAASVARFIGPQFGLDPAASALIGSGIVGAAKEAGDWLANLQATRRGEIPLHGVELLDFVATFAGGIPVALGAL